jgi:hypothetical protein
MPLHFPISPMTSEQWLDQFRINASTPDRIPWADHPTLSPAERTAVSSSIREFQLGESSEGRHLQSAADRFALATGDTSYAVAMRYFIREEQRHAAYLARFLADEGVALKTRTWADSAFRRLRHLGHLETAIAVLITAEIVAQVYYLALRRATGSRVLRAICRRVLADEAAHVRFQAERLAILRRRQGTTGLLLRRVAHRGLFALALAVVWHNHGIALARGGFRRLDFWMAGWRAFNRAAEQMDPGRYNWDGGMGLAA